MHAKRSASPPLLEKIVCEETDDGNENSHRHRHNQCHSNPEFHDATIRPETTYGQLKSEQLSTISDNK
jgi:hypothetical protein